MLDCMIIGDSIAVGTAMYRTECVDYARGGWNSWQWNRDYLDRARQHNTDTLIISLGSNDHPGVKTARELERMRSQVKAKKVFWIMPAIKPQVQEVVEEIANRYGDWIIKIPDLSKDGIHPTGRGYKRIAEITKTL